MDYIGIRFVKPEYDGDLYTQAAKWCTETQQARIEDKGDFYEVVAIPAPTFNEMRAFKMSEMLNAFNQRVSGSFTTAEGYNMQFDTSDSLKMQGAITLMESLGTTSGYITQADDTTVYNISIATMKAVLIQMLSAYAQCHARKQELRTLINNAQTKEELDEITISWPV